MAVGLFLLALLVRPALSQFRPDHNILANMPPADKTLFRFTFVVELRHSMTMSDGGQERLATFDESDSALKFIGRQTEGNSSDCTAKLVALGDGDERKIPIADGLSRKLLLVNGMLPGPTILVNKDATVEVMVINRVPSEAISIHWQGQSQNGTAWMDGSARVAQCQILPGQKFLYRFQADNSGTHWWRASLASQVAAGLYGPLIVVDRAEAETHEFEAEYVAVLQDLFLSSSESNFSHQPNRGRCDYIARSLDGTQMGTQEFPSAIVNGRGWYNSPKCSSFIAKPWEYPVEIFQVAPSGKRYKFRVIGANTVYPMKISIDYHSLHVVATDGNEITKVTVDQLIVHSGERFDFYITTNNDSPANHNFYAIRLSSTQVYSGATVDRRIEAEEKVGFALLQYKNGELPPSPTISTERDCLRRPCRILNCPYRLTETVAKAKGWTCVNVDQLQSRSPPQDLRPLQSQYAEEEIEVKTVDFLLTQTEFGVRRPTVNGYNFVRPSNPPGQSGQKLSSEMRICSSKCRSRPDCQCSYHLSVTEGKIIQLVVTNMGSSDGHDGISFPLHLPGRQFYVVKIGWPEYQEESNFLQSINPDLLCSGVRCVGRPFSNKTWATGSVSDANLLRPPLKDTVIVPVGGYVVLRFVAENPGWWLAETTVEQLQDRMSFLIKEGETHPTPPPSFPKCSTFLNNDADNLNGTASLQESSEEDQSGTNGKAKETGDHSTDSDESSSEEEDEETKTEVHGASGSQQYQLNSRAARVGFVSSVIGYLTLLLSQMLLASLAVTLPW